MLGGDQNVFTFSGRARGSSSAVASESVEVYRRTAMLLLSTWTPLPLQSTWTPLPLQSSLRAQRLSSSPSMKAPARMFKLSDWYGDDLDGIGAKTRDPELWVSPWAKAHYKLRQQELEIEQCEFMLQSAVEAEDYGEADGLKQRMERLKSQHPITPREERLQAALDDGNFALAQIFQEDLDSIMANLGLPKYKVGQAVVHAHRPGIRGVVMDVDLNCMQGNDWVRAAGCLERGCALDYPGEETDVRELKKWTGQPFYLVMLDLAGMEDTAISGDAKSGTWRWNWPSELAAWAVNSYKATPAPIYVSEDALSHDPDADTDITHPKIDSLFSGYDSAPHRGRLYQPSPRLRLWQQQRAIDQQDLLTRRKKFAIEGKNPYDAMR